MSSTNDKVKGAIDVAVGKIKETAGTVQKQAGKGQQVVGVLKDKFQKGSKLLGNAFKKAGDRIEHMAD